MYYIMHYIDGIPHTCYGQHLTDQLFKHSYEDANKETYVVLNHSYRHLTDDQGEVPSHLTEEWEEVLGHFTDKQGEVLGHLSDEQGKISGHLIN